MIALDDFVVVEKIGCGSYSTVYKAQRKSALREYVAVKVVEKARLSARGKDDIVTEIKVMKMLKHRHVVEMEDFKWDDKNIYIIMEFCDGGDLSSFIKKRCKLPEKVCQKFLQQLAIGLQFLRSHNLSHLDLKPQNLLLVTQPKITLKIGDFGFAQFLSDSTQKNSIRGSPLYMAPEMLLGGKYDAKADLWSVGVIAYECLFGKAPYSSSSYKELYSRIKAKTPIVIPDNMNLTEDCKDFLRKLLLHDPEKRMNYETFFNHPFLDLEHVPSEISHKKALKILKDAENLDVVGKHIEAFNRYCEGLRYLFPILSEETSEEKKIVLRAKITRYTKRAEELKCMLALNSDKASTSTNPAKKMQLADAVRNDPEPRKPPVEGMDRIIPRESKLKQLMSLCSNTPNLKTAIEIGMSAQMYLVEGKYKLALEKFQGSLGILLPSLAAEPPGARKELLYFQTQEWMKQAESTKSLLSVMENNDNQLNTADYKATINSKTRRRDIIRMPGCRTGADWPKMDPETIQLDDRSVRITSSKLFSRETIDGLFKKHGEIEEVIFGTGFQIICFGSVADARRCAHLLKHMSGERSEEMIPDPDCTGDTISKSSQTNSGRMKKMFKNLVKVNAKNRSSSTYETTSSSQPSQSKINAETNSPRLMLFNQSIKKYMDSAPKAGSHELVLTNLPPDFKKEDVYQLCGKIEPAEVELKISSNINVSYGNVKAKTREDFEKLREILGNCQLNGKKICTIPVTKITHTSTDTSA